MRGLVSRIEFGGTQGAGLTVAGEGVVSEGSRVMRDVVLVVGGGEVATGLDAIGMEV